MSLSVGVQPLTIALEAAFEAGIKAMEAAAVANKDTDPPTEIVSREVIIDAGGKAFAAAAAPAIKLFIESGVVNTAVATTGTAVAQAGTGVGSVS